MQQISTEKEEILMKAKQIRAQYEAQNKRSIKHRSTRRGMLAGIAAAAAVLVCGTVTVGAINDWNYAAVFSKYFSEKSGEPVYYDFTGMGLDIGQVIECDDFTMTIQSIIADTSAVYVAYDIELSDEINAQIAPYDDAQVHSTLSALVIQDTENGSWQGFGSSGHNLNGFRTDDNIWHCMTVHELDFGTDLSDKQLLLQFPSDFYAVGVGYNYPSPNAEDPRGEFLELYTPETEFRFDLADITVQSGLSVPYGGTLPNDANENIFEEMVVTPFMLSFEIEETLSTTDKSLTWGYVWGDDIVPVTYSAIYADGTEIPLSIQDGDNVEGISGSTSYHPNGTSDHKLSKRCYFTAPLDLDGLVAIRMNDIEIPVQ